MTLMGRLISSPDLAVIQVEMDVYQLLKRWLYVQLNDVDSGDCHSSNTETHTKTLM